MIFAGAQRFHRGGIVGLAPDEVPIIAQKHEEVLTAGDPRHRNNIGRGGASDRPQNINIVNAFDKEEAAQMLLSTRAGEQMILNIISQNPRAVKAALG